jgi:protein-disulfide isomerase
MITLLAITALMAQQYAVEGNPRSPVRVLVYESMQSSETAAFMQSLDDYLLPRYGSRVAFEHRPLPDLKQNWAVRAAMAALHFDRARAEAGLAWRRFVLARQKETSDTNLEERVREFAREHDLDPTAAIRAMASTEIEDEVQASVAEGRKRGISKAPTVIVGSEVFNGKISRAAVAASIEKALGQ